MAMIKSSLWLITGICLLLSTSASAHGRVPNVYIPARCPPNAPETYLSVTNAVIPAPIDKVWAYVGDFFDITWQNLTVTSTTGIDNKPGATRTFSYGFPVVETLLQYVDTPQVKYYEYGFSLENSAPATVEGILFTDLVNLMKTTNITAGADAGKTSFEYTQRGCATDGANGIIFWDGVHIADLELVIGQFS